MSWYSGARVPQTPPSPKWLRDRTVLHIIRFLVILRILFYASKSTVLSSLYISLNSARREVPVSSFRDRYLMQPGNLCLEVITAACLSFSIGFYWTQTGTHNMASILEAEEDSGLPFAFKSLEGAVETHLHSLFFPHCNQLVKTAVSFHSEFPLNWL